MSVSPALSHICITQLTNFKLSCWWNYQLLWYINYYKWMILRVWKLGSPTVMKTLSSWPWTSWPIGVPKRVHSCVRILHVSPDRHFRPYYALPYDISSDETSPIFHGIWWLNFGKIPWGTWGRRERTLTTCSVRVVNRWVVPFKTSSQPIHTRCYQ